MMMMQINIIIEYFWIFFGRRATSFLRLFCSICLMSKQIILKYIRWSSPRMVPMSPRTTSLSRGLPMRLSNRIRAFS